MEESKFVLVLNDDFLMGSAYIARQWEEGLISITEYQNRLTHYFYRDIASKLDIPIEPLMVD